jgi:hypothetical protein
VGIKKWWGKEEDEVYQEYTLSTMKKGYLVDYDLKTWQVIGYNTYDFDGFVTREWELRCADEVRFLEAVEDDGRVEWTWTQRIDIQEIQENVVGTIIETDDPPQEVRYEGRLYEAVESSAGLQRAGGEGRAREFVNWSYEAKEGRMLFISQWGERDFAAYEGICVEEYQFTDILPGGKD